MRGEANGRATIGKCWQDLARTVILLAVLAASTYASVAAAAVSPVYRFYNERTGTHFYTISAAERDKVLASYSWFDYEGAVFYASTTQDPDTLPVYRFYNNVTGTHFYTISEEEKQHVIDTYPVFIYEGPVYYAPPGAGTGRTALFRFFNTKTSAHFYTTSADERDHVLSTWPWFAYEGTAFFVYPNSTPSGGGLNQGPKAVLSASTSQVSLPGSLMLTVDASDPDGSVSRVDFYQGSSLIGSVTSAPYTLAFSPTQAGNYTFSAVAYDNAGMTGSSNSVTVTASTDNATPPPANQAPKITLGATSTMISVPGTTTLTASASDADGSIANVAFFQGGTLLGEVTSAPYTLDFTASVAGSYSINAVATDNQGATTTSNTISVVASGGGMPPSNQAPTVTLSAPTTALTVGSATTLTANASDADGTIASVQFYVGASLVATVSSAPYTYSFNGVAAGSFSLSAVATDNQGATTTSNTVTIVVSAAGTANQPPTISLSAASTNLGVPGSTLLTATAADADGTIARVTFYQGATVLSIVTSAPYTYTFNETTAGTYHINAVATDNLGATASSNMVAINATAGPANVPPTVTLAASSISIAVGATTTLTATAADSDGTVAKVDFKVNGATVATDTTSPYTYVYTGAAAGTYTMTATATDNSGAATTSSPVTVTVTSGGGNQPPTVTLAASSTSIAVGATTTLTATAADSDGTVSQVDFKVNGATVATDTTSPYTYVYTGAASGTYTMTATATDNVGATTTSAPVSVTVTGGTGGNQPPTITLAASATTVAQNGVVTLTATAADSDGTIAKVDFKLNGGTVATDTTSPYTYTVPTAIAGTFSYTATATDNLGAVATSSTVTITVTGTGAVAVTLAAASTTITAPGSTLVTATPSGANPISKVVFMSGIKTLSTRTTAPYTYTFSSAAVGSFGLTAVVTDNKGATATSNLVTITASNGNAGNQPPKITLSIPTSLVLIPATVVLTATGVSDSDGTISRVTFFQNGVSLGNITAAPYTVTVNLNVAGTYTFYAEAQDNANGITQTVTQNVVATTPPASAAVSADVWSLLNQATFGASQTEAAKVVAMGVGPWIDNQFTLPMTNYPDSKYSHIQLSTTPDCANTDSLGVAFPATSSQAQCNRDHLSLAMLQRDFFINAVTAPDQLRQRVAWALSQIVVTSANEPDLSFAYVMSRYQNIMFNNAFGNYQQLLMDATLNPAMGNYLDMVNNDRASGTRVPNENYAREIQQLFSVGLNELNLDGTSIVDASGMPVPTYDQNDIKEFAKVFTGWTYADPNNPGAATATKKNGVYYALPLIPYPTTATSGHETSSKTLLNGSVVPANQTPLQDIQSAVLNVFMHPNTPVYIGKQLIQRLVTGNPSKAYITRIANVFIDNGSGVRGDLKAVVKAVLTDPEARGGGSTSDPTYGTLREPVLMITGLIRALGGITDGNRLEGAASAFGQRPYYSPTVFNYFPPDNTIQGTTILAPEFTIHTSSSAVTRANTVFTMTYNGYPVDTTIPNATGTKLDTQQFEPLAANAQTMVDKINEVLLGGALPTSARDQIVAAVNVVPAASTAARAQMAVYLMASSYFYQVQH